MAGIFAPVALVVFPICLLAAAISDMRRFIIPNEISLALVAGFGLAFAVSGLGWNVFTEHALVGVAALAIGFGLFCANVCGAGDSKLLAACALWLGLEQLPIALVWMAVAGGVLALGFLIAQRLAMWFPRLISIAPRLGDLVEAKKVYTPYGVAIAIGALVAFPETRLFAALWG